jgi:hypothetical protein
MQLTSQGYCMLHWLGIDLQAPAPMLALTCMYGADESVHGHCLAVTAARQAHLLTAAPPGAHHDAA